MRTFDKTFWKIFIPFLIIIGLILFFPYWFSQFSWFDFNFTTSGQIGDTIGGIMGPFIAIAASILTFFAFWVQYKANEQQRRDIHIERFESKFYEMIRFHRDNVSEISIGTNNPVKSRRAFIALFQEFKYGYHILEMQYGSSLETGLINEKLTEKDLANISFIVFFQGVGDSSDMLTKELLSDYPEPLIVNYIDLLSTAAVQWRNNDKRAIEIKGIAKPYLPDLTYIPFQGHISRLGHYYRHLFQAVKFVDEQPDSIVGNKYDYLKTLRAQLSSYEQLLLYYNTQTRMGKPWIDEGYLQNYCMVKNIPLPLADFGPKPVETLGEKNKDGRSMFEWKDVIPNSNDKR